MAPLELSAGAGAAAAQEVASRPLPVTGSRPALHEHFAWLAGGRVPHVMCLDVLMAQLPGPEALRPGRMVTVRGSTTGSGLISCLAASAARSTINLGKQHRERGYGQQFGEVADGEDPAVAVADDRADRVVDACPAKAPSTAMSGMPPNDP